MKPIDTTDLSQADALSFDIELMHPPEKVWKALTDPDLLAEWLLPTLGYSLSPGVEFQFKAEPKPGWDGIVSCRIVEIETPTKLKYAWDVGDLNTFVTFTLTPRNTGCLLSIKQSGFKPDQKQNLAGARYGWRMMSEKLIHVLAHAL